MVLKCRHRKSGQLVAIKKFLESEDDKQVHRAWCRLVVRFVVALMAENVLPAGEEDCNEGILDVEGESRDYLHVSDRASELTLPCRCCGTTIL